MNTADAAAPHTPSRPATPAAGMPGLAALQALCAAHGGIEAGYLDQHYGRIASTWHTFSNGPRGRQRGQLLDIGSHWLHQTLVWRLNGFAVTAVDVPATIDTGHVQGLAAEHGITLCRNSSLEQPDGLAALPADSQDLILMSEVIEHLAFNPVALWQQLYRVLKPGGAVILTTPNYYALRGRAWHWGRFLRGHGGGLGVEEILATPTMGPHWREFSLAELHRYFALLSPDWQIERALRLPHRYRRLGWLLNRLERLLPPLRDQIYMEIGLPAKVAGITATPRW